jgi:hypothetical protein
MTKPISVLSRSERGSMLKEPTKTRSRSTAKVLPCRLAALLPARRREIAAEEKKPGAGLGPVEVSESGAPIAKH